MTAVSTNYRELFGAEIEQVAERCASAWQDVRIPARQYELALGPELEDYRQGRGICAPFAALLRCMGALTWDQWKPNRPKFLDVGASCGFVSEVLDRSVIFDVLYTGVDYSEAFREFALGLYPEIDFDVADANMLPYHDDYFEIVLSAGCIMHCRNYIETIGEAIRVAKNYVIFHRTPVGREPTRFFQKEAYGIPCLEVHFNEDELLSLFALAGTNVIYQTDVATVSDSLVHRSYVLAKCPTLNHVQV